MTNFVILPILIPLLTGIILLFFPKKVTFQKVLSFIASVLLVIVSVMLVFQVHNNGIQTLELGGWQPPFGIVLVADMLAILLVSTTSIVSLAVLLYSFYSIDAEREKYYYYPFFQFLITGVVGAFLTGDIFNLFVFFEVMLIASYILIVHGGTKVQLRESFKYVLVNVISSALFVAGVAYLYAVAGTLNMAHLSERIGSLETQAPILTVIAVLFLIVFGLKGALFPLYFWLPASYAAPPSAIAAIFGALLTKVGIYSIFRTYSVVFVHDTGYTHQILAVLAALTMIFGVVGAVAHQDVKKILVYNVIVAVGFVLFGVSTLTEEGFMGAIFYLMHDMVIKGALFLLIGAMVVVAGTSHLKDMGGLIKHHAQLGWMFFTAVMALVGIPPLSGFIGKLLLVQGGVSAGQYWIVAAMMVSSLLVLYSMIRIFLNGFYGKIQLEHANQYGSTKGLLLPSAILIAVSAGIGLGAEMLYPFVATAAETLLHPEIYIDAVLKE
ncbi:multisubunit sodium/proton antiporter, MrpD subunit [Alteribacillus persepolensis]|uniref:Multisubunit sodium/proton antiporter, MrpD subunit n=1 Tax=Alteribacillus persepolensis TaxID=568899 RepID=A0A1G8CNJ2_9BACI|nr:Na+/H+ antiporter subunit D [Alteribacillus persepolensis]SDH46430.1 multisubunit sodium/proton antiporter, MrpD subunit [Alteribacillus persepolensis]